MLFLYADFSSAHGIPQPGPLENPGFFSRDAISRSSLEVQ